MRGVDVNAITGADSVEALPDGGFSPLSGVALLGWQNGAWSEPLGQTTDSARDAGRLTVSLSANAAARLSGSERMRFTLRPRGIVGPAGARVSTDYVEATVRYRLPAD